MQPLDLRSVLAQLPIGVVVRDVRGALLAHNDAAERILGLSAAQLAGHEPPPEGFGAFEESGASSTLRLGERLLRGESIAHGHLLRLVGPHGSRWLSIHVELLREAGETVGVVYTFTDVTEQRLQRERELDFARLRGLENRINEIEMVIRLDGAILEVNDRACEAYGYRRDELLSMNVRELRAEETRAEVSTQLAEAAEMPGVRFRTHHRRRDGASFPVEVSSRRVDVAGTSYLHSLVRDLTEEERMQSELRERDERLRSILAAMVEGVVMHDDAGRLVTANAAAEDLLGISRASGTQVAWLDPRCQAIREDGTELPSADHPTARALRTGQPIARELVGVRRPEGDVRWLSVSARVLRRTPQGAPSAVVTTFTDVTSLLDAQREITTLSGLLPVCMWCKKIRDDTGYWERIEAYLAKHTGAQFSHGLCPDCVREHYPDQASAILDGESKSGR